jgi:hypothetical protein
MTWYKRKIAIDMDTGERHPVVVTLNFEWDEDLSPTIFFTYFNDVPIHNAITQCLDTLDMTEFMQNDLSEKENEAKVQSDPRFYEKNEGRGMGEDSKIRKGEKAWKKKIKT